METHQLLALQFGTNLLTYTCVLVWFVWPRLRDLPREEALVPLIMAHTIRTLGLFAMMPSFSGAEVARSTWARHVVFGDLTAVLLALVAVGLLRRRHRFGLAAAWVFNVWGLLDALRNCAVGVALRAPEHMGAMVFVPAYAVPLLLVSHALVFKVLLDARRDGARDPPS